MADASKLKTKRGRGGLGSPPGPDEVATSLNAPEIAPVASTAELDASHTETDSAQPENPQKTLRFIRVVTDVLREKLIEHWLSQRELPCVRSGDSRYC
jgi:hypothetical protein